MTTFGPRSRAEGSNRVLRGGSSNNNANNARVAYRNNNNPDNRNNNNGFRLVLPLSSGTRWISRHEQALVPTVPIRGGGKTQRFRTASKAGLVGRADTRLEDSALLFLFRGAEARRN